MPYSSFIQIVDRLSIKSALRGSTATIWGIIGTLALFALCLAFYIPPTISYFKGIYFQSEFYTYQVLNSNYYEGRDFKSAIVFRNRINNSVANHKAILQYATAIAYQLLSDQVTSYQQQMQQCDPNYFSNTINPIILEDCFLFPHSIKFDLNENVNTYSKLYFILQPNLENNPFSSSSSKLSSYQLKMQNFLNEYYYQIYITSKLFDSSGNQYLKLHSFYSTESQSVNTIGISWNAINLNKKRTIMDNSIMPWINNITYDNLIWLGQSQVQYFLTPQWAAQNGIKAFLTKSSYSIISYRYYKKLDWLLGIIGGAMLLFYILLWSLCNYINKTLHLIRNTESLLLVRQGKIDETILASQMTSAKVSNLYWLSNPVLDYLFQCFREQNKLILQGQRQLDIVNLIKKIKIFERTSIKKNIHNKFIPKILDIKTKSRKNKLPLINQSLGLEGDSIVQQRSVANVPQSIERAQQDIDKIFNFTQMQNQFIKGNVNLPQIYSNNITMMVFLNNQQSTANLMSIEAKNKWGAVYPKKIPHIIKRIFYKICSFIQLFDMFGAKPNLLAQPHNSTLLGFLGTIFILTLSILSVCLTIANANVPQIMVAYNHIPENNISYFLQSGSSLKLAACFSLSSQLKGINRQAEFRFFTESKSGGRIYIPAVALTQSDYDMFDLTFGSSSVNLQYCFRMQANHEVFMGNTASDYGYFGFRIQPYCTGTPSYCKDNTKKTTTNFLKFINNTYIYLHLPQNRFNPGNKRFINNLLLQPLNIQNLYMQSPNSIQEVVFVDHVQIMDDTKNFFLRKSPITLFQGIAINPNIAFPLVKTIQNDTELHYQVRIHPSSNQINYTISTPKADTILGIIGGVFIFWYAILHWMGKIYSSFSTRARLAQNIYDQQNQRQCFFNKLLVLMCPKCLLPACCQIKKTVTRMKIVDKKIINDLDYLRLVKYVDNCFRLSSALFGCVQQRNLSLVFVKQKIGQSQQVVPIIDKIEEVDQSHLVEQNILQEDDYHDKTKINSNKSRIANQFHISKQEVSLNNIQIDKQIYNNGVHQNFKENKILTNPEPFPFSWMDAFQYTASLTLKGKRQSTSCFGGLCCIILLIFIILVASFEVKVYLDRSDSRVSLVTSLMQPIPSSSDNNSSSLSLITGTDFKLAVTFGTKYDESALNVSQYIDSMIGISVFQHTNIKLNDIIKTEIQEYQMIPCQNDYLISWLSPLVDPSYYSDTQFGFCIPDGIVLQINGIPQDQIRKFFVLSIFNKNGSSAGNTLLQKFLNNYLPRYHFSVPVKDYYSQSFRYQIQTMYYDYTNITKPTQNNLTLSKIIIINDDLISFQNNPTSHQTYNFNSFSQYQYNYNGLITEQMYYNLTFCNSYVVSTFSVTGDKYYETFGIIGGLIALFIFGLGTVPRSFNHYKIRYLIGKQLYIFQMLKNRDIKQVLHGKNKKSKQQNKSLSDINNFSEAEILFAYVLSFIGGITRNYNFSNTLRRITLIQQRVQKDLSIYNVYQKLHLMRDSINQELNTVYNLKPSIKLTDIYPKHIYNEHPQPTQMEPIAQLKNFAKKHNWSSYEQQAVIEAVQARVNLKEVFDNKFLDKAFNVISENSVVNMSQYGGTTGSIGTNSMAQNQSNIEMIEIE